MDQRDPGREHHPLDDWRAFAERLNTAFAFDSDRVAVDAVVERRDSETPVMWARQRDSWCFTMRATPLQNRHISAPTIERPAISIDAGTILLLLLFLGIVAARAERLQIGPSTNLFQSPRCRFDVVDHGCDVDLAALGAEFTQRVLEQLLPAAPVPIRAGVEVMPRLAPDWLHPTFGRMANLLA